MEIALWVIGVVLYMLSVGIAAGYVEERTSFWWDDPGGLIIAFLWPLAVIWRVGYWLGYEVSRALRRP